jgi:hypothetical protein
MPTATATRRKSEAKENKDQLDKTYNEFKEFEGQVYTGAKIGRRQKWYYDEGEWRERKLTPDRWEFEYAVTKRRAGHAPEGSGVPVGTEYHWFIVAHQNVRKLDANDYSTAMTGAKFKVAHKRAGKDSWSSSERAQRKRLIKFLQEMIDELQQEPEEEAAGVPEQEKKPAKRSTAKKVAAAKA